ncbi:MAG TPA: hypothetical protein VFX19_09205 [Dehalococcoidia bacterium]|nr:hypothetical protein [Dehalococcoidia bacterium]
MRHRTLFENVKKYTGMYLPEETFPVVAAFLLGYDEACEGGLLAGFREWLVVRLGTGSNLSWPALVLLAAFPGAESPENELSKNVGAQRHAIDTLFDLVAAFDGERSKQGALKDIFGRYQQWLTERGID